MRSPNPFALFTDAALMLRLLREHAHAFAKEGEQISACEVLHAWRKIYAKPESAQRAYLTVCYRLTLSGKRATRELLLQGVAYFRVRVDFAKAHQGTPLTLLQHGEIDLALYRFPDDPQLPQLAALVDTTRVLEHLPPAVLSEIDGLRRVDVKVINYRPGERCTLRFDVHGALATRTYFAKTYRDDTGATVHRHLCEFGMRASKVGQIRVAQPLGYDTTTRTVWQRGLNAQPGDTLILGDAGENTVREIACSLAALHGSALSYERVILRERTVFELRKRAVKLCAAYPEWEERLRATVEACARLRHALPTGKAAIVHGDAHVGQFMLDAHGAIMCDFDELAYGDPEQDLANVIVTTQLQTSDQVGATLGAQFLEAYVEHAGAQVQQPLLQWYACVQSITKAYRALWRQAPDADNVIARALQWATQEHDTLWRNAA